MKQGVVRSKGQRFSSSPTHTDEWIRQTYQTMQKSLPDYRQFCLRRLRLGLSLINMGILVGCSNTTIFKAERGRGKNVVEQEIERVLTVLEKQS